MTSCPRARSPSITPAPARSSTSTSAGKDSRGQNDDGTLYAAANARGMQGYAVGR